MEVVVCEGWRRAQEGDSGRGSFAIKSGYTVRAVSLGGYRVWEKMMLRRLLLESYRLERLIEEIKCWKWSIKKTVLFNQVPWDFIEVAGAVTLFFSKQVITLSFLQLQDFSKKEKYLARDLIKENEFRRRIC